MQTNLSENTQASNSASPKSSEACSPSPVSSVVSSTKTSNLSTTPITSSTSSSDTSSNYFNENNCTANASNQLSLDAISTAEQDEVIIRKQKKIRVACELYLYWIYETLVVFLPHFFDTKFRLHIWSQFFITKNKTKNHFHLSNGYKNLRKKINIYCFVEFIYLFLLCVLSLFSFFTLVL